MWLDNVEHLRMKSDSTFTHGGKPYTPINVKIAVHILIEEVPNQIEYGCMIDRVTAKTAKKRLEDSMPLLLDTKTTVTLVVFTLHNE